MQVKIGLTHINGTPVYKVRSFSRNLASVYGGAFSDHTGFWYYPAYYPYHDKAISDMKSLYPTSELTAAAQEHYDRQELLRDYKLNEGFTWITEPDDYQRDAMLHCLTRVRSGALMDCGLGKTKVIIDVVRYLSYCHEVGVDKALLGIRDKPKVLCVVKSSVLYNWPEELEKHAGKGAYLVEVVDGYKPPKLADGTVRRNTKYDVIERATDADFLIVTYEQAATADYAAFIQKHFKYNMIVADESHKLQSWRSRNTQNAVDLAGKAHRRIIATGTATLGDPRHLFGQFRFLAPHLTNGSYHAYCRRYLRTAPASEQIVLGFKNLNQLNDKVKSFGKIVKIDGKIKTTRSTQLFGAELSKAQNSDYDDLVKVGWMERPDDKTLVEYTEPIVKLGKAHQITGGFINFSNENPTICDGCEHMRSCVDALIKPYTTSCKVVTSSPAPTTKTYKKNPKLALMMDKLEDVLSDDSNAVIITYRFQQERQFITAALTKANVKHLCVLPSTSAKAQLTMANKFESDPTVRVYLAQISTLVGINLVRAKYIFFYSLSLDLKDYEQARGRNYRRTQTAAEIFEFIFYTKNTLEEMIIEALKTKSDIKELILSRQECLTCPKYAETCRDDGVKPWSSRCILDKKVDKQLIRLGRD